MSEHYEIPIEPLATTLKRLTAENARLRAALQAILDTDGTDMSEQWYMVSSIAEEALEGKSEGAFWRVPEASLSSSAVPDEGDASPSTDKRGA